MLSKYGVARHIYIPIVKRAVVDFAVSADWTPAAGDVKISKDGGAAANVTNLPTAITMGNTAYWDFSLTATEMQAAQIIVTVADSATKAVEDQAFIIETYGHASAQHEFDLDSSTTLASILADTDDIQSRLPAALVSGRIDASIGAAAANSLTASALAADAVTEIVNGILGGEITELAGVPAASPSLEEALALLYMALRNKRETTSTSLKIHNDAGAVIATASATDDGTTTTIGELA